MSRLLLPICLLIAAAAFAHAQQQEQGLLNRIDTQRKMIIESSNSGKSNPALASPLSGKSYGSSSFDTKNFGTGALQTKGAQMKTYATKSFFGIKNPWFGKATFETKSSHEAGLAARESSQQYKTDAFAVSNYDKASKKDLLDTDAVLPANTQPRKFLGPEKPDKSEGIDKFTQNLSKDLTIDDVRDLLNKGKGE